MPAIGVKTAKASKGPAMTQVMTETLEVEIGGDRGQGGGQDGDRERRAGHPGERHHLHGPRAEPTVVGWGEKAHRSTLGERSFTFLAV